MFLSFSALFSKQSLLFSRQSTGRNQSSNLCGTSFFKRVWDKLHVQQGWKSIDDEEGSVKQEGYGSAEDQAAMVERDDDGEEGNNEGGSDIDKEEMGDQMNALIKAAAIWLTEQDATTDST